MKNNKLLSISIIILAISIFSGCMWIGYSIQEIEKNEPNKSTLAFTEKGLLTELEASEYLSITVDQLRNILKKDSKIKQNLNSYDTYRFIPHIELDNGTKLFNKKELDEWIDYNMN